MGFYLNMGFNLDEYGICRENDRKFCPAGQGIFTHLFVAKNNVPAMTRGSGVGDNN